MNSILAVSHYLKANHPKQHCLSRHRLLRLVYLADWRAALVYGLPLTDTHWVNDHVFPQAPDALPWFRVDDGDSYENVPAYLPSMEEEPLTEQAVTSLDYVLEKTKNLNWTGVALLVQATHPAHMTEKGSVMDLNSLAIDYRKILDLASEEDDTPVPGPSGTGPWNLDDYMTPVAPLAPLPQPSTLVLASLAAVVIFVLWLRLFA